MNRVQYVSQVAVPDHEVRDLTNDQQDQFIAELNDQMVRDMRTRTKDAKPEGGTFSLWVTGPHDDPLQGTVHVHNIAAWFDLDTMAHDAQFRLDYLTAGHTPTTHNPIT